MSIIAASTNGRMNTTVSAAATVTKAGLYLSDAHRQQLDASGISDAVREARGYWTAKFRRELETFKFPNRAYSPPALMIPWYSLLSLNGEVAVHQMRPDHPRQNSQGKDAKYEFPYQSRAVLDFHPFMREQAKDPDIPLFITEGIKKGDCLTSHGQCTATLT